MDNTAIQQALYALRTDVATRIGHLDQRVGRLKVPNRKGGASKDHRDKREPEPPDRPSYRYHKDEPIPNSRSKEKASDRNDRRKHQSQEVSRIDKRDMNLTSPTFAGTCRPADRYDRKNLLDPDDWRRRCERDDQYYRSDQNNREKYYHRETEIKHKATVAKQSRPSNSWGNQSGKDKHKPAQTDLRSKEPITDSTKDTRPNPGKSSNSSNLVDPTCYRCHKRGHFAATCPTRQVVTTSKIVLEKEKSKEVKEIVECEIRSFNSCIMHLSLPRDVDTGKWKAKEMIVQRDEPALIMSRTLSLIPHANEKHEIVLIQQKEKVSTKISPYIFDNSKIFLMHLLLVKGVEILAGTKEKNATHDLLDSPSHNQGEPRVDFLCERRNFAKEDEIMCQSNKHGVIYSMLIKEEPPDAKHQLHPSHHQNRARGNLLNLHLYQDTNLLSLGAGLIVSRSKPFQEGEYDEDIKSSSAKEREIMRLEEADLKLRRPLKFTTQQQNRKSPNQPKKQLSVLSSYENYIWKPGMCFNYIHVCVRFAG